MKYLDKSFSVFMGGNKQYSENYDTIFRKPLRIKIKNWIDTLLFHLFIKE